jgi:hypothetical protein
MSLDEFRIEDMFASVFGDSIRSDIPMRLGNPITGAVSIPIEEIGVPGMVWVHGIAGQNLAPSGEESLSDDDKTSATAALLKPNKISPGMLVYGAPVLVELSKGMYSVTDLDGVAAVEFFHDFRELEQRSTDISQFDTLLTRPTKIPSLSVEISEAFVTLADVAYHIPNIKVDLTSYVPTSVFLPDAIAVRLDVDPVTSLVTVVAGTPFDNGAHMDNFASYDKDITPGCFMSSWVKLVRDMTVILIDDILHAQEVYSKGSTTASAEVYSCNAPIYWRGKVIVHP